MLFIRDQRPSLVLEIGDTARTRAVQIRQQRDHRARQRRMLRLELVDVICDILHAAGDMRRLVPGGGEDVVGGDNARATDRQKKQRHQQRPAIQKHQQSGVQLGLRRRNRSRSFNALPGQAT
jgi:hypothetical protein